MGFLPRDADILPPSDGRIFKLLPTAEETKPALIHLLSALLGRKVVDVTLYPNEPPATIKRESCCAKRSHNRQEWEVTE